MTSLYTSTTSINPITHLSKNETNTYMITIINLIISINQGRENKCFQEEKVL